MLETLKHNCFDMLVIPQLLDSGNFKTKSKNIKWVKEDLITVSQIISSSNGSIFVSKEEENKLKADESTPFDKQIRKIVHKIIEEEKYSIEKNLNLPVKSLLYKDKKDYNIKNSSNTEINLTYMSLPIDLNMVKDKYGENSIIECIEKDGKYAGFVILSDDSKVKRRTAYIYSFDKDLFFNGDRIDQFYNKLKESNKDIQDLEKLNDHLFLIHATAGLSRKLLWPEMKKFLTKH